MIYTAQQVIAALNRVRAELHSIADAVSSLRADLQQNTQAINAARDGDQEYRKSPPVMRAELNIPEAIVAEAKTAYKESQPKPIGPLEKVKKVVEIIAAIGVAVYAFFAVLQWIEMTKNSKAASDAVAIAYHQFLTSNIAFKSTVDQFRIDQRAWLGAESNMIVLGPGQTDMTIVVKNFGRAPAVKVAIETKQVSKSDFAQETRQLCLTAREKALKAGRYIIPGSTDTYPLPHHFAVGGLFKFPVGTVLAGCIAYWGQFGADDFHHTEFCFTDVPRNTATPELKMMESCSGIRLNAD